MRPFKYTGSDADVAALAEGLSEEIVTGLSRFSYLRVVARGAARFKTVAPRYVMEGSLRQAGSQLRLAVQLVDTTTGAHLWAETYERPFHADDVFALQDDLVPRIVSTVADRYGVLRHSMSAVIRQEERCAIEPSRSGAEGVRFPRTDERRRARESAGAAGARRRTGSRRKRLLGDARDGLHRRAHVRLQCAARSAGTRAGRRAACRRMSPSSALASQALAQSLFFRKELQACRPVAERTITLNPMDGAISGVHGDSAGAVRRLGTRLCGGGRGHEAESALPRLVLAGAALPRPSQGRLPWGGEPGRSDQHSRVLLGAADGRRGVGPAGRSRRGPRRPSRELLAIRPDFGSTARAELESGFNRTSSRAISTACVRRASTSRRRLLDRGRSRSDDRRCAR